MPKSGCSTCCCLRCRRKFRPVPRRPDQQQIGFNINSEPLLAGEPGSRTREKLRQQLREGKLDERIVELEVREKSMPAFEIITNQAWKRWTST